jgi:dTDP-4-dehydrorhamnose 3,5-epimerase
MIARETGIKGALIIAPEQFDDERGFFARTWSKRELSDLGVAADFIEGNLSYNKRRGTLRGMHYQAMPYGQAKLVRCTRGSIFDVGVDLRPDSPTFRHWTSVELTEDNRLMLYLPGDFGHGYLTLKDDSEVYYQVTGGYAPEALRGFRWNDPAFNIQWPNTENLIINPRDMEYPDFG